MPVLKGLEWTFDTVASTYERLRPGYAEALYRAIFDYIPIGKCSKVVEIGIGGGQATPPILQTGCELTAVEYGENFSALCREKFRDYPGFSALTGKFEDVELENGAFDLIYSASAFHWIPEEIGYPKVHALLKNGGAFARFANHPYRDKGNPALADALDGLYHEYYDRYYNRETQPPREYTEEQAANRAQIAAKYGFTDIRHALFRRTRTFTAAEYITLLGTYSDHIAMAEPIRTEFFAKIEEAINTHGGTITIYDTMDLQLARKA